MEAKHPYKSFFTIALSLGFLGLLVGLFSEPVLAKRLENMGFKFTSRDDIYTHYFKPKETTKVVRTAKSEIKQSKQYKELTQADRRKLDSLITRVSFLENFPLETDHTCLSNFFDALRSSSDTVVHVWYYGDSQIEGDRITQDLRTFMQAEYGGSGLGYIPFSDVATYRSVELKPGTSWLKLNCFNNKSSMGFGFAGKVFKLNVNDSNFRAGTSIWISPTQAYKKLYLLYGKSEGGTVVLHNGDSSGKKIAIEASTVCGKILLSHRPLYGNINLSTPTGTNYFGFLLEGKNGIQVDNCGIRGHSGDGLKFISDNMLKIQAQQLNARLVVFHYGNNMVPYLKSQKGVYYYQKGFEQLFARYRKLMPNASFLVVSPGDMGATLDGEDQSYPFIADLTEMLRNAAKNTGCAFFDMYSYMKKDGGIINWTTRGLANLDGHLSYQGQRKFSKALYEELQREYKINQIYHQTP